MDKHERENWQKIKDALEKVELTDSMFYIRAKAICEGKPDPLK